MGHTEVSRGRSMMMVEPLSVTMMPGSWGAVGTALVTPAVLLALGLVAGLPADSRTLAAAGQAAAPAAAATLPRGVH